MHMPQGATEADLGSAAKRLDEMPRGLMIFHLRHPEDPGNTMTSFSAVTDENPVEAQIRREISVRNLIQSAAQPELIVAHLHHSSRDLSRQEAEYLAARFRQISVEPDASASALTHCKDYLLTLRHHFGKKAGVIGAELGEGGRSDMEHFIEKACGELEAAGLSIAPILSEKGCQGHEDLDDGMFSTQRDGLTPSF